MSSSKPKTLPNDPMVARGQKNSSPNQRLTFIGLRALDPLLQYTILVNTSSTGATLLTKIKLPQHAYTAPSLQIHTISTNLTPHGLILLLMATGSCAKQIYWASSIAEEEMLWTASFAIPAFNFVFDSVNSLLSTTQMFSADHHYDPHLGVLEQVGQILSVPRIGLGAALFVIGLGLETVSEVQRKNFKKKAENKGKVYKGGLFSLARHINYGGFTLWRTGYALAGGGWVWASVVFGFFAGDFARRAIPVLDKYCDERYGEQWRGYKTEVRYKLFPGIY